MTRNRASRVLLVSIAFGLLLGGCSVIMAVRQPDKKDLSVLSPGQPRALVIRELGAPEYTELSEGQRVDYFDFVQGYTGTTRYSRAALHAVADTVTIGLWELVGTPTEMIFDGTEVALRVSYSRRLGVHEVIVIRGGDVVKDVPGARYASVRDQESLASVPGRFAKVDSVFAPGYQRRVAAVIGINDYETWPALEGARADAESVAKQLRDRGFEVLELYDGDATRDGILNLIGQKLKKKADVESLAVVFFAGHGQTEMLSNGGKRGYIVPVDGNPEVFSTAISMEMIRDLSNRLAAKHVYYIMDSCYSGLGLSRGLRVRSHVRRDEGYLGKMTSTRAVQMITAGREGEVALEIDGRGIFTQTFLRALEGEADFNEDGWVTASEIGAFVPARVTSATDARQTPMYGTLEGNGEVVFSAGDRAERLIAEQ